MKNKNNIIKICLVSVFSFLLFLPVSSVFGAGADYIYSGSGDDTVKKISPDGDEVWSFTGHTNFVSSVAVDTYGYVYSGSGDDTVRKISPDGDEVWSFTGHTSSVNDVAVDTDGYVYSGSFDDTVRKISPGGDEVWSFTGHSGIVYAVAVDADGYVYSGSADDTVKKISPEGDEVWSFTDHTNNVKDVAVDTDGYVYSGSCDDTVRKISPGGDEVWSFTDHTHYVNGVAVDTYGYVYSASFDGTVKKISPDGDEVWSFTDNTNTVAVDADGYVYSGSSDDTVKKISPEGDEVWSFTGHTSYIYDVTVYSPSGSYDFDTSFDYSLLPISWEDIENNFQFNINNEYFLVSDDENGIDFNYRLKVLLQELSAVSAGFNLSTIEDVEKIQLKFYSPDEDNYVTFTSDSPYSVDMSFSTDWKSFNFYVDFDDPSTSFDQKGFVEDNVYYYWFEVYGLDGTIYEDLVSYSPWKQFIYLGNTSADWVGHEQTNRQDEMATNIEEGYIEHEARKWEVREYLLNTVSDYFSSIFSHFPFSWIIGTSENKGLMLMVEDVMDDAELSDEYPDLTIDIDHPYSDTPFSVNMFPIEKMMTEEVHGNDLSSSTDDFRDLISIILWVTLIIHIFNRGKSFIKSLATLETD